MKLKSVDLNFIVTVYGLWLQQTVYVCVCVCVCVCLSVCPAFTAYTSLPIGWILVKLRENVETLIRLIVIKFHKNRVSFDVIMTSLLSFKIYHKGSNSAQSEKTLLKGKQLCCARL